MAGVVIGIVGFFEFVRGYPLGPETMQRLRAAPWPGEVEIREMNWGPVAIVQEFQARSVLPQRVVLLGAQDRGLPHGTVSCRRWVGGDLDVADLQRRMFEAVTGIVSVENLLVIGAHFGIWPAETFMIELQWPESGLGDLVLEEASNTRGAGQVVGERPLSSTNERIVRALVAAAYRLGTEAAPEAEPLGAAQLAPVKAFSHYRFSDTQQGTLQ